MLVDVENEQEYVPLQNIAADQARCDIYNSTLSEAAVMGFEYGYSRDYPEALVMWEAQFGDFANVAQAVIDQFVSAGEDKWGLLSGLVLLLPHGHEGQGPEHSSARIERFLQLAARDNFQICQPSNGAQYFHLLRRQALSHWRKPLVVFTPKSMLRHPDAASPIEDFTRPHFLGVVPDQEVGTENGFCFARERLGTNCARNGKNERILRRRSCLWISSIRSRNLNWRRNWSVTPTRVRLSGCRKSRPTWVRCSTCCRGCGIWRESGRCGR